MESIVFPLDIISDILSRLPVKFLLRFRCVSKVWCSLIDSKEFVKKHLNQSKQNLKLITGFERSIFSISLDSVHPTGEEGGLVYLDHYVEHLAPSMLSGSIVLNSCNGLILAQISKCQALQLCIWNPFTSKYIELPDPPIEYPVGHESHDHLMHKKYAFAYVPETDDYKVVRVLFKRISWSWLVSETNIFSSTSNEWKRIEDFPYVLSYYERKWGVHLNGILHTVVEPYSSTWSIMGFDVRSEEHAMVPKPELDVYGGAAISVDVLGGCLCVIKRHFWNLVEDVDVWVMKDYGVKDSWFKLLSLAPPKSNVSPICRLQPLSYSNNGEEVLLREIDGRLFWYNLGTKIVEEITVNKKKMYKTKKYVLKALCHSPTHNEICFESLVSLPGFISMDNVKEHGDLKKKSKKKKSTIKRNR